MRFFALLFAVAAAGCSSSMDGLDEGTAEYSAPPVVISPIAGCWYRAGSPMPDGATCITLDKPVRWGHCETLHGFEGKPALHVCIAD